MYALCIQQELRIPEMVFPPGRDRHKAAQRRIDKGFDGKHMGAVLEIDLQGAIGGRIDRSQRQHQEYQADENIEEEIQGFLSPLPFQQNMVDMQAASQHHRDQMDIEKQVEEDQVQHILESKTTPDDQA